MRHQRGSAKRYWTNDDHPTDIHGKWRSHRYERRTNYRANVIEKGTTNGAVTDFDGKFSLSLQNKQSILVVTYIGYNTKEIPAGNGSPLTIQLQDDTQNLDEVIVVGYSCTEEKKTLPVLFPYWR